MLYFVQFLDLTSARQYSKSIEINGINLERNPPRDVLCREQIRVLYVRPTVLEFRLELLRNFPVKTEHRKLPSNLVTSPGSGKGVRNVFRSRDSVTTLPTPSFRGKIYKARSGLLRSLFCHATLYLLKALRDDPTKAA